MTVTFESSETASPPVGTVVASDTIGGIDYQRIKVVWGTTGTATEITTEAAAGFPVQLTAQSSALNVTTTPSSQETVSVTPTSQWTVTTTPSTTLSVAQSTTPWLMSISTSTGAVPVIGAVAASTQWTVSTTPTSQATVSVTPTTQFTVSTTPTSQITASVAPTTQWTVTTTPSTTLSVAQSTTPWSVLIATSTGAVQVIGSVAPSSQWTVSTTPTSQMTVSVTPTTQFTVTTTPSSQITASVTPTTQFTVTTTPSSQVTVTAITTAIQTFAAEQTVIMSSGVAQTVLYKPFAASATGLTVVTTAVTSKIQVLLAVQASCGSSVCQISWRNGTSSTTLIPPGLIGGANGTSIILPWNPVGWVESLSGEGLTVNIQSTGTPAVGGCVVYAAI